MARIAPLILFIALPLIAHGQLYKWVDKDGKVQYSDKPPPADARQQKKMEVRTAPAAAAAPASGTEQKAAGPKTIAEQELEFRKRRAEQEEKETKQAAEQKERQQNCTQAQTQLRNVEFAPRVVSGYDAKGEPVVADDAARQKIIQDARQEVEKWCK